VAFGVNIKSAFLVYYSVSLVTDNQGCVQIYFTKRDQAYKQGTSASGGEFVPGPAEKKHPTSMLSFSASAAWGAIEGSEFRERGTRAYKDWAVDDALGVGPVVLDHYNMYDKDAEKIDRQKLSGYDIGLGVGAPFGVGSIAMKSIPITDRWQMPKFMLAGCKSLGLYGSYPPPFSYFIVAEDSFKRWRRNWKVK